jgi:hypothetical protein
MPPVTVISTWDFNESFGTFNMGCQVDVRELYIDEPTSGAMADRPLINSVFSQQDNLDVYHDYIWQLVEGSLEENTFAARVAEIAAVIRSSVENDPTGFYGSAAFEQNLNSTSERFFAPLDKRIYVSLHNDAVDRFQSLMD